MHSLPMCGRTLTVRDGEKGPVEIEMVKRRVQTRLERKRTGPEEWLVVTRRPLADDRLVGGPAPLGMPPIRTPGYRYQYYLTPTGVQGGAGGAVAGGTGAGHQSGSLH